ncbi:MAG: hypothetical protein JXQ71_14450 [Verrucomicrobia bacterium]|nr:hypothetical protein [Verrucomicrobiota bacterium]
MKTILARQCLSPWPLIAGLVAWTLTAPPGAGAQDEEAAPSDPAAGIRLGRVESASRLRTNTTSFFMPQQVLNEGYYVDDVDVDDVDAYFWHIFKHLAPEIWVYPSENYYYFADCINGRQVWGNIRLPAGRRERGVLSFGYSEFTEFPSGYGSYLSRSKYFTVADGLQLKKVDPLTWDVLYNQRTVRFHLHSLSQAPPQSFHVRPHETFIMRTFDESGLQFFLLFNTRSNYFFWVLNEEEKVPDHFSKLADDILVGRRTGFAFWVDGEQPPRKVLATIRKISVTRNDYYDGPFDQLADNYVDQTQISKWMERAIPSIKGRIDKYGYYTDVERPSRVALSCYGTYYTQADILEFVKKAKASADPYHYISRGGVPLPSELAAAYGTNWARAYASGAWTNLTNRARPALPAGKTNAESAPK